MRKILSNKKLVAYLGLVFVNIAWALANSIIKITLQEVPLYSLLFFRFLVVCTVLLPFIYVEIKRNPVDKKDYFNLFILGIFSQTSLVLIFAAYQYTTILDATIIGILGTLMSVVAGHYFYKEKTDVRVKIGLIVASIGTFLIVIEPILQMGHPGIAPINRLIGNFLALLYNVTFLFYIIWSKMSLGEKSPLLKKSLSFVHLRPLKKRYSPTLLSGITFYVGLLTFIPLYLMETMGIFGTHSLVITQLSGNAILGILYLALISSIAAYMIFEWSLTYVTVSDSALFSYLSPVFSFPFAFFLLGETPSTVVLISSAIIAVGVIIAETRKA